MALQPDFPRSRNLLIQSLAADDFAALEPHLERVPMREGHVILAAHEPIDEACFPEGGVASVHDVLGDGTRIGIGIIGCEGLTGWPVLMGCKTSPHEATVAIAHDGTALRIAADRLRALCADRPSLNHLLLRFVQTFVSQMGRTIVSNLCDSVEQRLARWLLMNQDRLQGNEIELTHKQIGIMLGVRRASVTDALHLLEGEHLIAATRGRIAIQDRGGLKALAGESYGAPEAEYSRLIGRFPSSG